MWSIQPAALTFEKYSKSIGITKVDLRLTTNCWSKIPGCLTITTHGDCSHSSAMETTTTWDYNSLEYMVSPDLLRNQFWRIYKNDTCKWERKIMILYQSHVWYDSNLLSTSLPWSLKRRKSYLIFRNAFLSVAPFAGQFDCCLYTLCTSVHWEHHIIPKHWCQGPCKVWKLVIMKCTWAESETLCLLHKCIDDFLITMSLSFHHTIFWY